MVLCEILYAVNVVLQIYLTDLFLGRQFVNLGINVILEGPRFHVAEFVFPKVSTLFLVKILQLF